MDVSGSAKIRLEWLAENEPEYLHELLQTNQLHKLEKALDDALLRAAMVIHRNRQRGMNYREAHMAVETVLAPADGRANMEDPAPKPLPEREKQEIYRRLQARDEAQQSAQARSQQRRQKSREN
jgi:hypothetical protein